MSTKNDLRSGYVAIIGRPNVGKSTLLNHLLAMKLSITSRKPQTTRHQLLGILTKQDTQYLFIDTPGIHRKSASGKQLNRYMNRQALSTLNEVDVILILVEATKWHSGDQNILKYLKSVEVPVICVVTKIDRLKNKNRLLPHMAELNQKYDFKTIVPVSSLQNEGLSDLLEVIREELPQASHTFKEDDITDRPVIFLIGELVREQVVRQLGAELPHQSTVAVEKIEETEELTTIDAQITVARTTQKRIVIGHQGQRLGTIGERARKNIAVLLGCRVRLNLHVRVRSGWTEDQRTLKQLGF